MPGDHVTLTDELLRPETYTGDPHEVFAALRAIGPLTWNSTKGFWAVSTHADVVAASSDPATFCSGRGILVEEIGRTYDSPPTMMHTDPPAHTRYRGLVQPAFKPSAVRSLDALVRELASSLVASLPDAASDDGIVDVVHALAEPFPLQVIGALLGMDASDQDRLVAWSNASIPGAGDFTDDERLRLMGEMTVALLGLAAATRADGAADGLIATLAAAELDGERLTSDELGMFLVQLLVAGNETTRNALSGGLVALAERADEWDKLRTDRSLVPTAVEEILRWTTPVISFMRTATRDCELGGTRVAAGDPLLLLYASANRDEAEFGPSAGTFDVARNPNHHVAFGFGPHFCVGAALARLELRAALELLLERFVSIEIAGDVVRSGSSIIAGVRRAPMRMALSHS